MRCHRGTSWPKKKKKHWGEGLLEHVISRSSRENVPNVQLMEQKKPGREKMEIYGLPPEESRQVLSSISPSNRGQKPRAMICCTWIDPVPICPLSKVAVFFCSLRTIKHGPSALQGCLQTWVVPCSKKTRLNTEGHRFDIRSCKPRGGGGWTNQDLEIRYEGPPWFTTEFSVQLQSTPW